MLQVGRARLAAAVSEAAVWNPGAGPGRVRSYGDRLTGAEVDDQPFGVNIPVRSLDPELVEVSLEQEFHR